MKQLLSLIQKDLVLELRRGELMVLMGCLAVLLSVMLSFGVTSAMVPKSTIERLYPALCWLLFVFAATLSMTRAFVSEDDHNAIEGLCLAGVSPATIYLARAFVICCVLFVFQLAASSVLAILLGLPLVPVIFSVPFIVLTALVVLAYTGVSTLLSAMAAMSRLGGMLLPLLLFPLLFPVLFSAIELTAGILSTGSLDVDSWWFTLLLCMTILYVSLGSALFEFLIGD